MFYQMASRQNCTVAITICFDDDYNVALLLGRRGLDFVVIVPDGGEVDSMDGSILVWLYIVVILLQRLLYLLQLLGSSSRRWYRWR